VGFFRYRDESGKHKFWPVKDIVRGRSVGRPTHPIFVIFPLAFFIGSLAFDVLSLIGLSNATLAATYLLLGGLIGAAFAIATGLLDRAAMRPGSLIRRVATRHMIIQLSATAIFLVELIARWSDTIPAAHRVAHAKAVWIVLGVIGMITVIVGGDVGFNMVFRMGARVEAREARRGGTATPEDRSDAPGADEPSVVPEAEPSEASPSPS
jgi:uncharacterized membrane protein